jgi:hypothetical protein
MGREPIYLIDMSRANIPPPRANFPRRFCDACQFTSYDRTEFQFTSFGSVAEPIYLLPEAPSQFTSSARRLSVVAGVLKRRPTPMGRDSRAVSPGEAGRASSAIDMVVTQEVWRDVEKEKLECRVGEIGLMSNTELE